jgi:hypothetical protein
MEADGFVPAPACPCPSRNEERVMPRKNLIRRFEPLYGVSREAIDAEAVYVAREHEDRLLASINDLRTSLEKIRIRSREADEAAESLIHLHGEREALAYRCLIARDLYHILELYCTTMRAALPETAITDGPKRGPATAPADDQDRRPLVPFSEWLFEGER